MTSFRFGDLIAFDNPHSGDEKAADRVLAAVEATCTSLASFPHRTQIGDANVFRTTVDGYRQYLILYRFDDRIVEVLRIFRSNLDWTREYENL